MKNVWKGLVLGAVTGAAVGAGIDRRSQGGAPGRGLAKVVGSVPGGTDVRDGLSHAADRLSDIEVAQPISNAADAARRKVGAVVTDSRAADAVRDGAGSAAATGRELADAVRDKAGKAVREKAVRDKAGKAVAEGKEVASTIVSGLAAS
jgi:hypothetical protein